MTSEKRSGSTLEEKIIRDLARKYPPTEKDIEISEALRKTGKYEGHLSLEETEVVIRQIAYIFMETRGRQIKAELTKKPIIGRLAKGPLIHNVLKVEVDPKPENDEVIVDIKAQVVRPAGIEIRATYPLKMMPVVNHLERILIDLKLILNTGMRLVTML